MTIKIWFSIVDDNSGATIARREVVCGSDDTPITRENLKYIMLSSVPDCFKPKHGTKLAIEVDDFIIYPD